MHSKLPILPESPHIEQIQQCFIPSPSFFPSQLPTLHIANSKDEALTYHVKLCSTAPSGTHFFYTDGSLLEGESGAGVAAYEKGEDELEERGAKGESLGQHHTVYEAELVGIRMALEVVLGLTLDSVQRDSPPPPFIILADNQAALSIAFTPGYLPGQHLRFQILQLYLRILQHSPSISVSLVWVPGHRDVEGNELADEWAKKAASGELDVDVEDTRGVVSDGGATAGGMEEARTSTKSSLNFPKSSTSLLATYKSDLSKRWAKKWRTCTSSKYLKRIDLHDPSAHILRLHDKLPRPLTSLLTQLRSGFSYLNADLYRVKRATSDRCLCGAREDVTHFFLACPLFATQRRQLVSALGPFATNLPFLLSSSLAIPHTLRFVLSTSRFPRFHSTLRSIKENSKKTYKNKT